MSEVELISAGTWVEVTQVVLPAGHRPETVPADTRQTDLILRVRGFLTEPARPGDQATVRTLADRLLTGLLTDPTPRFSHDFGQPVPELLEVGSEIRRELRGLLAGDGKGGQP